MKHVDDMLVFLSVVKAKSFSAAAEELEISRALVSKKVNDLEARLGTRLLNRTTRKISLTGAGEKFNDYCSRIDDLVNEAEEAIRLFTKKPSGSLRTCVPILLGQTVIAPAIPEFLESYPLIRMSMHFSDEPVDIIENRYDVVIRFGHLPDSSLVARKLVAFEPILCASDKYLREHGEPRSPRDLSAHNCITYSPLRESEQVWHLDGPDGATDVRVSGNIEANSGIPILDWAKAGVGIICIDRFRVRQELKQKTLRQILCDCTLPPNAIWALYPHHDVPLNARVFVEFASEKLNQAIRSQSNGGSARMS